MREQYLPSVCQLHAAIYNNEISVPKSDILLKQNEVTTLQYLIAQLLFFSKGNQEILDGYFVGYSIPQLGNEFDLLRFGENVVVNIELKNELPEEIKEEKISAQLKKHSYYLKFLGKPIELFTFVESDGLYRYNTDTNTIEKVNPTILVDILSTQILTKNFNIEYAFNPANYLISPFNKVDEFLNGEYFLTPDQSNKKKDILNYLLNHKIIQIDTGNINDQTFFCTAGIGFEGKIAHLFDKKENNKRGFQQYLQLIIQQAITYKPVHAKIRIDDKIIDDDFSSICFANANQWGNNGFIAPTAKLTDGLLNVTLIKPFPITNLGFIVTALLGGYIDMIPHYVTTYKAKEIEIIEISNPEGHIDGEPYFIQPKTKISINKQSLNVAVPIDFQEQSVRKLDEIELKINNLNNAILSSIQNSSVPTHTIELKKLLFNQLKKLLRR
jgi:hypothetical protein